MHDLLFAAAHHHPAARCPDCRQTIQVVAATPTVCAAAHSSMQTSGQPPWEKGNDDEEGKKQWERSGSSDCDSSSGSASGTDGGSSSGSSGGTDQGGSVGISSRSSSENSDCTASDRTARRAAVGIRRRGSSSALASDDEVAATATSNDSVVTVMVDTAASMQHANVQPAKALLAAGCAEITFSSATAPKAMSTSEAAAATSVAPEATEATASTTAVSTTAAAATTAAAVAPSSQSEIDARRALSSAVAACKLGLPEQLLATLRYNVRDFHTSLKVGEVAWTPSCC